MSSEYCLNILFSPLVFLLFCTIKAAAIIKIAETETIPALFAFGDSILDTGNNNNLVSIIKTNFPPYGRDFVGGKPTGRASDGKVPSDLIAEALGIKELLPAYLHEDTKVEDFPTGVCFASSGSGYDPLTTTLLQVLSLSDQLDLFKEYITKLRGTAGEDRANFIISNGLYIVSAGNNDIGLSYFLTQLRKLQYDVPSYNAFLVASASSFLKELYELGARRIAVFSTIPLGCVPILRTLFGGIQRVCPENIKEAAELFNANLSTELHSLSNNLPDANIFLVDVYNPLLHLSRDPAKFGFEVGDRGCCGTGTVEFCETCNELVDLLSCSDASKYAWWDSVHPSEMGYKILVSQILQKNINN
ncbi:GDSL esterase/lipase At3g14820-like isoform X1 [Corylus avellana]|uniref:GDSL esterase/lipase At3g14820-like isoform X1 n=1 Tax=Corylus avellana TaxID=13451 RepID=UPI00286CE64D|nr:GDSL esterase/lipase At3g14820-like isoform X1 [Corylus avellana]